MCARGGDALESTGLSAEVIDLRTVWPPDVDTVAASVARTNRLVVVEECPADAGWAASLIMDIIERQFDVFDAAPQRVSADPTPIPYSPSSNGRGCPPPIGSRRRPDQL